MGAFLEGFIGGGGSKVFIDGVKYKDELTLQTTAKAEKRLADIPADVTGSNACVFKGKIHAFGTSGVVGTAAFSLNAYSWDGAAWSEAIVVMNGATNYVIPEVSIEHEGEVHFFKADRHAKWDGENYAFLGTLPISISNCVCSRKDKLHIFKGTSHYKLEGSEWVQASTLPFSVSNGAAVVDEYDNIHILDGTNHYMWNGTAWTQVSTLPYSFSGSSAIFNADGKLEIMGSAASTYEKDRYMWNGTAWTQVTDLTYMMQDSSAVLHEKHIYRIGGDEHETMFTVFDVKSYKEVV